MERRIGARAEAAGRQGKELDDGRLKLGALGRATNNQYEPADRYRLDDQDRPRTPGLAGYRHAIVEHR